MHSALRHSVIALLFAAAVAGCGQMGPLYLPGAAPVADSPAREADGSAPAAENAEPGTVDSAPAAGTARPDGEED